MNPPLLQDYPDKAAWRKALIKYAGIYLKEIAAECGCSVPFAHMLVKGYSRPVYQRHIYQMVVERLPGIELPTFEEFF